jgi:transposase
MSSYSSTAIRTLRLPVKDKHASWLSGLAREVNTVFNYCNELSVKVYERERRLLSGFDFWPFLKGSTRAIHAKVANRRTDFLHKLSTRLVKGHGAIFVGNVNASYLAKTPQAKSVLDAGWSAFRTMLLGIRGWQCSVCGAVHDRDVNAAQNIRSIGTSPPCRRSPRSFWGW